VGLLGRKELANLAPSMYGDQHNPILLGDPVVAAFDWQNVLAI
jgi:hypothetical protein